MNKSVVHRILTTLLSYGWVEKDETTNRYYLGWAIYTLAQKIPQQNQLYNVSINYLTHLSEKVGETINLGIMRGLDSIIIYKIEAPNKGSMIRVSTRVGEREASYATSLGKAIMAGLDDDDIRVLFAGVDVFKQFTNHTISNINQLLNVIQTVRIQGYALDNQELISGISCIAMPVRDYSGRTIAAVSVSSPSSILSPARKEYILKELKICTNSISTALGYNKKLY